MPQLLQKWQILVNKGQKLLELWDDWIILEFEQAILVLSIVSKLINFHLKLHELEPLHHQ